MREKDERSQSPGGRRGTFTAWSRPAHGFLMSREQTAAMITRRMKIRRQLRSVRASALSEEECRQELRETEACGAHGHVRDEPAKSAASPRAAARAPRGHAKREPGGRVSAKPTDAGPPRPLRRTRSSRLASPVRRAAKNCSWSSLAGQRDTEPSIAPRAEAATSSIRSHLAKDAPLRRRRVKRAACRLTRLCGADQRQRRAWRQARQDERPARRVAVRTAAPARSAAALLRVTLGSKG